MYDLFSIVSIIVIVMFGEKIITIIRVGLGDSFVFIYLNCQRNVFLCTDWNVIAIG